MFTAEIRRQQGPGRRYDPLINAIENDPTSAELWRQTVNLAVLEEAHFPKRDGFYDQLPLAELVAFGQVFRMCKTEEEKYRLLTEKNSLGLLWYDVVLGHINQKFFRPLSIAMGERKWKNGLDIGTGTGDSLVELATRTQTATGVDRLDFMLECTSQRADFPSNASLRLGSAENLPFENNQFEVIISNGFLPYLPSRQLQPYIGQIDRLLKKEGSYFEVVPIAENPQQPLLKFEKEYGQSAKSVLVFSLDRFISKLHYKADWDLRDFLKEFRDRDFKCVIHDMPLSDLGRFMVFELIKLGS